MYLNFKDSKYTVPTVCHIFFVCIYEQCCASVHAAITAHDVLTSLFKMVRGPLMWFSPFLLKISGMVPDVVLTFPVENWWDGP
jgi:hypothetical protein